MMSVNALKNYRGKRIGRYLFYINTLLEEHLAEIEHAFTLKADAEAVRSGKQKTYSLAEARTELGL